MSRASRKSRRLPPRVLVFGEDQNDTKFISELLVALQPGLAGKIKTFRRPPVLIKDADPRQVPTRVESIASLIDAERTTADVVCVFAHEDCDDFEPAHEALSTKIEQAFAAEGHHVHAVTPAWETEAWIFLWPDAVAAYRPSWAPLHRFAGRDLGKIQDAKETLRRSLRPAGKGSGSPRDYRESDAPEIARHARELNLATAPAARSGSYARFVASVQSCDQLDACAAS